MLRISHGEHASVYRNILWYDIKLLQLLYHPGYSGLLLLFCQPLASSQWENLLVIAFI